MQRLQFNAKDRYLVTPRWNFYLPSLVVSACQRSDNYVSCLMWSWLKPDWGLHIQGTWQPLATCSSFSLQSLQCGFLYICPIMCFPCILNYHGRIKRFLWMQRKVCGSYGYRFFPQRSKVQDRVWCIDDYVRAFNWLCRYVSWEQVEWPVYTNCTV